MVDTSPLYPLQFDPVYTSRDWGGRGLEALGRQLPGDKSVRYGESLELGSVNNGSLAGWPLDQVIEQYGKTLMGDLESTYSGKFPLLVQFIDAGTRCAVNVQKTHRAWYIVSAKPGAVIYKGFNPQRTLHEIRQAIESNDFDKVEQCLVVTPVKPGDCHFLHGATCNALGAGVVVAQIAMPGEGPLELFGWGQYDPSSDIEHALELAMLPPPDVHQFENRSHIAGMFTTVTRLVTCDQFQIEKIRMSEGYSQEIPYNQPAIWIVLAGRGTIDPANGAETVVFKCGQTMLIPAELGQATVSLDEDTIWLEITFPQVSATPLA